MVGQVRRPVRRTDVRPWLRHRAFALLGFRPPIVQLSAGEEQLLCRSARGRRRAVELGVAAGGSAFLIAEALTDDATLDLVDPFFPGILRVISLHELIARRAVRRPGVRTRFHRLLSWDAPSRISLDPLDFLFIDGDHSEDAVRKDWAAWEPLLQPGAIVLLHDAIAPDTEAPGPMGPGRLLADLLESGWQMVAASGALAAIERSAPDAEGVSPLEPVRTTS
jgi:hypothetical protein